jgi:hypothetical protein
MVDLSSWLLFLNRSSFSSVEPSSLGFWVISFFGGLGIDWDGWICSMTHEEHICKLIWLDSSWAQDWGILRKVWKTSIWSGDLSTYGVPFIFWLWSSGNTFFTFSPTSVLSFISIEFRWCALLGESFGYRIYKVVLAGLKGQYGHVMLQRRCNISLSHVAKLA